MRTTAIAFEDVLGGGMTDKRVEILRAIHQLGSISEAARAKAVSYKAAWQAVETLNNLAGVALIEKLVGGSGGGGARLTPAGLQVLHAADLLASARAQALASIRRSPKSDRAKLFEFTGMGLRTSMRNQLPCLVREIQKSRGLVRVVLELAGSQRISARITAESLELLDLSVGMRVLTLFKAMAVSVAPRIVAVGGVNLLRGRVVRLSNAEGRAEVALELAQGLRVVGFADSREGLKPRGSAMAAVEESAVVIGLGG